MNWINLAPTPQDVTACRTLLRESARVLARDVRDATTGHYEGVLAEREKLRMCARFRNVADRFSDAVPKT